MYGLITNVKNNLKNIAFTLAVPLKAIMHMAGQRRRGGAAGPWPCGYCVFIILHAGPKGLHCLGRIGNVSKGQSS